MLFCERWFDIQEGVEVYTSIANLYQCNGHSLPVHMSIGRSFKRADRALWLLIVLLGVHTDVDISLHYMVYFNYGVSWFKGFECYGKVRHFCDTESMRALPRLRLLSGLRRPGRRSFSCPRDHASWLLYWSFGATSHNELRPLMLDGLCGSFFALGY